MRRRLPHLRKAAPDVLATARAQSWDLPDPPDRSRVPGRQDIRHLAPR